MTVLTQSYQTERKKDADENFKTVMKHQKGKILKYLIKIFTENKCPEDKKQKPDFQPTKGVWWGWKYSEIG